MNPEDNTSNKICDANSLVEPKEEMVDCPEVTPDIGMDFIVTKTKEELSDSDMADSDQQIINTVMPVTESHSERAGPHTADKLIIYNIRDLPVRQTIETPIHPKRMCTWQSSGECGSDSGQSTTPCPHEILHNKDIVLNYGSEAESDEGEEEYMPQIIPRVIWSTMDTPTDEDTPLYGPLATATATATATDTDTATATATDTASTSSATATATATDADTATPSTSSASTSSATAIDTATASDAADIPAAATAQPHRLFDFEWRAFPDPPIPVESRRETFQQSNVGPTAPCVDPYDIFVSIWDRQFMEYIASETNRYAHQVRTQARLDNSLLTNWHDTTVDELYLYFGLFLAMGIDVKCPVEEYWNTDSVMYTPFFSTHMSKDRFLSLTKCLHFANNEDMRALELDVSEAKIFKIYPLVSHLNKKFQHLYTPRQDIALDESLLTWKGKLDMDLLIPDIAVKTGIRTCELCECRTGYLWRFDVHAHKRSTAPVNPDTLNALTSATVLRLVQGLEHKGYTLWMESYYNSPGLARRLKSSGFDCVGTLRTDRQSVPQSLHNLAAERMKNGQITGFTSGDVDVMVWRCNSRRVAMISTFHGNATSRVLGSTTPILITDYNTVMGGMDKKDDLLARNPIERNRTKIWYKQFFLRLLNVSVLNSYIIHKESSSHLSHHQFRRTLVESLILKHRSIAPPQPLAIRPQVHRIDKYPFIAGSQSHLRHRRRCSVCKRRVQTMCVGCNKSVCTDPCFKSMH